MSLDRILKTLHGWLGILVMPWIALAWLTGLYENHTDLLTGLLPQPTLSAALYDGLPPHPTDETYAAALAIRVLPQPTQKPVQVLIFSRPGFEIEGAGETLRVDAATGAYWREGPFLLRLYSADGRVIATKVNWGKLIVRLHRAGWPNESLGTWPADIAGMALVVFGGSGVYLFLAPRIRRLRMRGRSKAGWRSNHS